MKSLPVVDGGAGCFDCLAPCCTSYIVPLYGFDLWRLTRGLQLPWHEVALVRADRGIWEGFRVDASEERLGFFLRTTSGETCRFLLHLPAGQQRCGAHSSRPLACRVYPWKLSDGSQLGVELISHAMCPPHERAHFESQRGEARAPILAELDERPLYRFAVSRWNDHFEGVARTLQADHFVAWILRLYDQMAPLRAVPDGQPERKRDWQQEARRLINDFPLP